MRVKELNGFRIGDIVEDRYHVRYIITWLSDSYTSMYPEGCYKGVSANGLHNGGTIFGDDLREVKKIGHYDLTEMFKAIRKAGTKA